jgi:FkbM family methyltransferase
VIAVGGQQLMRRYIEKGMALCTILKERRGMHAFAHWKPFSIASYQLLDSLRGMGLEFGTIIDAGANVGQFARASTELFPNASVFSIEAVPDAARRLRANLSDRPQVEVLETAVGSCDGRIPFYQNEYSLASSALPLKSDKLPSFGGLREVGAIEVPVARIDTLLEGRTLTGPVLLKLDLQGFELEALKGARNTLTRCDHVLVETSFDADYEGAPTFDDVLAFLYVCNFSFARPIAFLKGSDGRIVEMDALFENGTQDRNGSDRFREDRRASYHEPLETASVRGDCDRVGSDNPHCSVE